MSPPPMSPPPREAHRVDNRTDAQKALLGLDVQESYTREIPVLTDKKILVLTHMQNIGVARYRGRCIDKQEISLC